MIEMFDEVVDGLPVLHAAPAGKQGKPLPTLFSIMVLPLLKKCIPILVMHLRRRVFALFCLRPICTVRVLTAMRHTVWLISGTFLDQT